MFVYPSTYFLTDGTCTGICVDEPNLNHNCKTETRLIHLAKKVKFMKKKLFSPYKICKADGVLICF